MVWNALVGKVSLAFTLKSYIAVSSNSSLIFVNETIKSLDVTADIVVSAWDESSHLNSRSGGYIVCVSTEK